MRLGAMLTIALLALVFVATAWADEAAPSLSARCPEDLVNLAPTRRTAPAVCDPSLLPQELRASAPAGYVAPEPARVPDDPCVLLCPPCAYHETEPWPYDDYLDTWNGGCNSDPNVFEAIDLYYAMNGLYTLCGTSGNYLFESSTYRDTDWFEFEVTEPTHLVFCCQAEFPVYIHLIDGDVGCGSVTVLESAYGDTCELVCIEWDADPGLYWFWVGPSVFSGIEPGADYIMTIEGLLPTECVVDCPYDAWLEGEPDCCDGYWDDYNAGCNCDPYAFWPVEPSEAPILICGTGGCYPYESSPYRDTDWYEIILDEPREVTLLCVAEFPVALYVLDTTSGCGGVSVVYQAYAAPCMEAIIQEVLPPGAHWIFVSTDGWYPIGCGWDYILMIDGYTTAVETKSWSTIKSLYR